MVKSFDEKFGEEAKRLKGNIKIFSDNMNVKETSMYSGYRKATLSEYDEFDAVFMQHETEDFKIDILKAIFDRLGRIEDSMGIVEPTEEKVNNNE